MDDLGRAPVGGDRTPALRGTPARVEYLVRAARVTDIDRLVALSDGALIDARCRSPLEAADLMRQLVYLPQASIVVAETRRLDRGRGRPRAASVGPFRRLCRDASTSWSSIPDHDAERITEALVEELLRSASNKGCTVVETDPAR